MVSSCESLRVAESCGCSTNAAVFDVAATLPCLSVILNNSWKFLALELERKRKEAFTNVVPSSILIRYRSTPKLSARANIDHQSQNVPTGYTISSSETTVPESLSTRRPHMDCDCVSIFAFSASNFASLSALSFSYSSCARRIAR